MFDLNSTPNPYFLLLRKLFQLEEFAPFRPSHRIGKQTFSASIPSPLPPKKEEVPERGIPKNPLSVTFLFLCPRNRCGVFLKHSDASLTSLILFTGVQPPCGLPPSVNKGSENQQKPPISEETTVKQTDSCDPPLHLQNDATLWSEMRIEVTRQNQSQGITGREGDIALTPEGARLSCVWRPESQCSTPSEFPTGNNYSSLFMGLWGIAGEDHYMTLHSITTSQSSVLNSRKATPIRSKCGRVASQLLYSPEQLSAPPHFSLLSHRVEPLWSLNVSKLLAQLGFLHRYIQKPHSITTMRFHDHKHHDFTTWRDKLKEPTKKTPRVLLLVADLLLSITTQVDDGGLWTPYCCFYYDLACLRYEKIKTPSPLSDSTVDSSPNLYPVPERVENTGPKIFKQAHASGASCYKPFVDPSTRHVLGVYLTSKKKFLFFRRHVKT